MATEPAAAPATTKIQDAPKAPPTPAPADGGVKAEGTPAASANDGGKSDALPKDKVDEMLAKARQEEKDKLYPDLQKAKSSSEEAQKQLAAEREQRAAEAKRTTELEAKLQEIQNSSLSDAEKLENRLSALEAANKANEEAAAQALRAAKTENETLRLELHKANATKGLAFPDLVSGSTPEEIDASVEQAKARETQLRAQLREELRDEVAAELGSKIPGSSAAGDDTHAKTGAGSSVLSHKERSNLSKLRGTDYETARREKLQEAMSQIPDNHPLKQRLGRR